MFVMDIRPHDVFCYFAPSNQQYNGVYVVLTLVCLIFMRFFPLLQAKEKFPKGFNKVEAPSGKGYLRLTPQPNI